VLAVTRPTDWDFPLFVHILGATILVGGLVTAVGMQVLAWRRRDPAETAAFTRAAFWALLVVALPGWIVMRAGAQWIYSKEGWTSESNQTWLDIGFGLADVGIVVLVVAVVLAGLAVWRGRRSGGGGIVLGRMALPLATVLLVAYLVAVWAMTAKPT
jgi:hypothetical protein